MQDYRSKSVKVIYFLVFIDRFQYPSIGQYTLRNFLSGMVYPCCTTSWTMWPYDLPGFTAYFCSHAETARALYSTGARVFITARDMEKGRHIKEYIQTSQPGPEVELLELDLASLESVRKAAAAFLSKSQTLNILVTNAGSSLPNLKRCIEFAQAISHTYLVLKGASFCKFLNMHIYGMKDSHKRNLLCSRPTTGRFRAAGRWITSSCVSVTCVSADRNCQFKRSCCTQLVLLSSILHLNCNIKSHMALYKGKNIRKVRLH